MNSVTVELRLKAIRSSRYWLVIFLPAKRPYTFSLQKKPLYYGKRPHSEIPRCIYSATRTPVVCSSFRCVSCFSLRQWRQSPENAGGRRAESGRHKEVYKGYCSAIIDRYIHTYIYFIERPRKGLFSINIKIN